MWNSWVLHFFSASSTKLQLFPIQRGYTSVTLIVKHVLKHQQKRSQLIHRCLDKTTVT